MDDDRTKRGTKADREAPQWVMWALSALLVGLLVGAVGVTVGLAAINRQNEALIGNCQRTQTERERLNIEEARSYFVLKAARDSTRSAEARKFYDLGVKAAFYSPPADCQQATESPEHYRQPPLVQLKKLAPDFPRAILQAAQDGRPQPRP